MRIAGKSVLWHALVIAGLAVLLYPIGWLIATSFKPADEVISNIGMLPHHPTGSNYSQVFSGIAGISLWQFLGNSLLVSIGAVIGNVVVLFAGCVRLRPPAVPAARPDVRLHARHHHAAAARRADPAVHRLPEGRSGDTFWPIIAPKYLATDAFFVFLMTQFIRSLPRELDEAATIDGCGTVRIYRHVIAPLLRPAMITTAIFTFIWTWNDFFTQLIYLNSPGEFTLPLALQLYVDQTSSSSFGPMFAMSVLALVPIGLFFLAFQRLLVDGAATSGLKG